MNTPRRLFPPCFPFLMVLALVIAGGCKRAPFDVADAGGGDEESFPVGRWLVEDEVPGTANLFDVWGSGSEDVFVVGFGGAVYHYDGEEWREQDSGTEINLEGVWGTGSDDVYAVGWQGTILHYNGLTWSTQLTTADQNLHGVWGSGPNDIYAVGAGGTVLHFDGAAWNGPLDLEVRDRLGGVWGSGPDDVYVVGNFGTILHYDGQGWRKLESQTTRALNGVWGWSPPPGGEGSVDGGDGNGDGENLQVYQVFVVGLDGFILHYRGEGWQRIEGAEAVYIRDVWGSGPDDVYMVNWNGTVLHYDGVELLSGSVYAGRRLEGVWGSSADDIFAVGMSGTILRGP